MKEREVQISVSGVQKGNPYKVYLANGESKEFRSGNDKSAKYRAYRISRDCDVPTAVLKLVALEEK